MIAHPGRGRRRGAVLVLMAVCLIPIIMVMAVVMDGGMLLSRRREAQAVADASARAAACSL
jgi:Flp pilus assembly protein TadG